MAGAYFFGAAAALVLALHRRRQRRCCPAPPPDIAVTAIHVYPVKSMRGHAVPAADLDAAGLLHDRRWLVVSAELPQHAGAPARFLTQRSTPALATVTPYVLSQAALPGLPEALQQGGGSAAAAVAAAAARPGFPVPALRSHGAPAALLLVCQHAPQLPQGLAPWLLVPLLPAAGAPREALRSVQVWSSTVAECVDQGAAAAAWLSAVLGEPARLVHQDPGHAPSLRATASSYMPLPLALNPAAHAAAAGAGGSSGGALLSSAAAALLRPLWRLATGGQTPATSFADGFPLLLASENSLADLNDRMAARAAAAGAPPPPAPMGMHQFRPNLVVRYAASAPPWLEDTWADLAVGQGAAFAGVKRCSRCSVTTTCQASGARAPHAATGAPTEDPFDREPLATLASFRASARAGAKEGGVYFGMNLVTLGGGGASGAEWGSVRVGDAVRVRRTDAAIGPL